MPIIDDIAPDKATYRPGETAHVSVTVTNDGPGRMQGRIRLALVHIDETLTSVEQGVELEPGAVTTLLFIVTPPSIPMRGYGLDASLYDESDNVLTEASGALDVLERWSQAPRYGFLSDFGPEQTERDIEARGDSLRRYHLNVVQFYDWMWRHYKLLPPPGAGDEFTDALDRRLSLRAVREAIARVQTDGSAAMAYGAVYGAEPEFADQHPELRLYDEEGKPVSLAELFYIMNIDPASPWVSLIVAEFAQVVREMGFDGIHLDQYGFPHTAQDSEGKSVDLAVCFPGLIDLAREAVVAERPGAGVIFNAVTNWPIETVAQTSQDAVYIEVWPPYESYNDLRDLIGEGKRLSGGKQVILAAYLSPFLYIEEADVLQAEAAALLATAAITASGGFHLLLGEQDGVLCDPYYPKYATLSPKFVPKMRAYYDFLVRYEELFSAPDVEDCSQELSAKGTGSIALSARAERGKVWTILMRKPGYLIVHLLNLFDQRDINWNALRTPPGQLSDLEVQLGGLPPVREVLAASPDIDMGRPVPVQWRQQNGQLYAHLPQLRVWTVLICPLPAER